MTDVDWSQYCVVRITEYDDMRAEIERLRVALALACNELFGICDPLQTSPKELMAHFVEEARRGDR